MPDTLAAERLHKCMSASQLFLIPICAITEIPYFTRLLFHIFLSRLRVCVEQQQVATRSEELRFARNSLFISHDLLLESHLLLATEEDEEGFIS